MRVNKTNNSPMIVWEGEFGKANKGELIPYSEKVVVCKKEGCLTQVNGYRVAKGNKYCSQHQYEGYDREAKQRELMINERDARSYSKRKNAKAK